MIKVLHKVFDIFELLAETPDKAKSLSDIAGKLKMHPATCANILQTMVRRHYVEQIAPRKGYVLGPLVFHVTRQGPYRKDLVTVSEQPMEILAKDVNETVLLVILRQGRRFILSQINGQQHIQVGPQALGLTNIYETATGRLLLAYMPEHEVDKVVAELGLPGKLWRQVDNITALRKALAKIRNEGWVCHSPDDETVGIAFPIHSPAGHVIAAIGLFLPKFRFKGRHEQNVVSGLRRAAKAITQALEQKSKYPSKTME
ncbi:MAG: IclR family transcriptional regulator [Kiritimatiellae bacterium]|nr:IclR family transcriptional regulator [Kiritimatiellia bacterium]MDD5522395.1 IclR family transcriptional regulator [Kiritimatiellia bacterium]